MDINGLVIQRREVYSVLTVSPPPPPILRPPHTLEIKDQAGRGRCKELGGCMKVELALLVFPSLIISIMVSVDVEQHLRKKKKRGQCKALRGCV